MNKKQKTKKIRKTRKRGGFFNAITRKNEKDNIKDWYLYWKNNEKYKTNDNDFLFKSYDNQLRYPGYFNTGLFPEEKVLFQSDDISTIPGCVSRHTSGYSTKTDVKYNDNMEKCGANLTYDNEKKYKEFWKCKYPKFDNTVNWVGMSKDASIPNCKNNRSITYNGPKNDLLPTTEELNL